MANPQLFMLLVGLGRGRACQAARAGGAPRTRVAVAGAVTGASRLFAPCGSVGSRLPAASAAGAGGRRRLGGGARKSGSAEEAPDAATLTLRNYGMFSVALLAAILAAKHFTGLDEYLASRRAYWNQQQAAHEAALAAREAAGEEVRTEADPRMVMMLCVGMGVPIGLTGGMLYNRYVKSTTECVELAMKVLRPRLGVRRLQVRDVQRTFRRGGATFAFSSTHDNRDFSVAMEAVRDRTSREWTLTHLEVVAGDGAKTRLLPLINGAEAGAGTDLVASLQGKTAAAESGTGAGPSLYAHKPLSSARQRKKKKKKKTGKKVKG